MKAYEKIDWDNMIHVLFLCKTHNRSLILIESWLHVIIKVAFRRYYIDLVVDHPYITTFPCRTILYFSGIDFYRISFPYFSRIDFCLIPFLNFCFIFCSFSFVQVVK